MKRTVLLLSAVLSVFPAVAGTKGEEGVKEGPENHFRFYGFVRNFFAFDTRESVAGTGDLFYYLPKDRDMNENGSEDLNAQPSFRFLSLTSRLGVDVNGYKVGRTSFGAKVETDFYAGLTSSSASTKINGTAQLRLRQVYMTIGWDDLKLGKENRASVALKIGQAWHPMAADQPHVLSLETGAPFNPFSRTPQVLMDASLGKHFVLSAGAIWQMQYLSVGPNGASAEYLKYSCIPECYLGVAYKTGGFSAKAGLSILSIKPRRTGTVTSLDVTEPSVTTVRVSDRITTCSPYIFLQYRKDGFEVKAKTVFSQAGEHMNLMSGYGISARGFEDGHYEYTPLRTSSTWVSLSYGKKWQVMLMGGYIRNLGTAESLVTDRTEGQTGYVSASNVYFSGNGYSNLNAMWRLIPAVAYNIGKFTVALEYNVTSAQYGDYKLFDGDDKKYLRASDGLASDNLHWVTNHRLQAMVRFTF